MYFQHVLQINFFTFFKTFYEDISSDIYVSYTTVVPWKKYYFIDYKPSYTRISCMFTKWVDLLNQNHQKNCCM